MASTLPARFVAALRLVGVTVVLAAGIAGFASGDSGGSAAPVPLLALFLRLPRGDRAADPGSSSGRRRPIWSPNR